MLPLCTPVKLMATVTSLKARKCVIDWELISLTELDRKGAPVRHRQTDRQRNARPKPRTTKLVVWRTNTQTDSLNRQQAEKRAA